MCLLKGGRLRWIIVRMKCSGSGWSLRRNISKDAISPTFILRNWCSHETILKSVSCCKALTFLYKKDWTACYSWELILFDIFPSGWEKRNSNSGGNGKRMISSHGWSVATSSRFLYILHMLWFRRHIYKCRDGIFSLGQNSSHENMPLRFHSNIFDIAILLVFRST